MSSTVEERAAILELLARYLLACDRRDLPGVAACFTIEAQAEYSGVRLPRGVEHIVRHMAPLARLAASQHVLGTTAIDFVDPEDRMDSATSTSYVVAHLVRPTEQGHEVVHRGLTYADRLIRTADGWKIQDRVHRVVWSTSEPTTWPVSAFKA